MIEGIMFKIIIFISCSILLINSILLFYYFITEKPDGFTYLYCWWGCFIASSVVFPPNLFLSWSIFILVLYIVLSSLFLVNFYFLNYEICVVIIGISIFFYGISCCLISIVYFSLLFEYSNLFFYLSYVCIIPNKMGDVIIKQLILFSATFATINLVELAKTPEGKEAIELFFRDYIGHNLILLGKFFALCNEEYEIPSADLREKWKNCASSFIKCYNFTDNFRKLDREELVRLQPLPGVLARFFHELVQFSDDRMYSEDASRIYLKMARINCLHDNKILTNIYLRTLHHAKFVFLFSQPRTLLSSDEPEYYEAWGVVKEAYSTIPEFYTKEYRGFKYDMRVTEYWDEIQNYLKAWDNFLDTVIRVKTIRPPYAGYEDGRIWYVDGVRYANPDPLNYNEDYIKKYEENLKPKVW